MSISPTVPSAATSPAASQAPGSEVSANVSQWDLDPSHSHAQFGVKHMMVSTVRGTFDKLSGKVSIDEKDPTRSAIEIEIDAASINTRDPKRDAHLRSPDFFDVEKSPTITFRSTKIQRAGQDELQVTGDLTINGVTKPATLTVTGPTPEQKSPWGTVARGVSATGKINRKDWNLNWNTLLEAGGVLVGEEVTLTFEAELVPRAAAKAG